MSSIDDKAIVPAFNGDDTHEVEIDNKYDEEKGDLGATAYTQAVDVDSPEHLRDVELMEERLQRGDATDAEYAVNSNHDIAIKVLSTHDDPELPVMTFRTFVLGLGFSCFGAVLAQLYYFKPQTLAVSQSFLLILTYFMGKLMQFAIPTRGYFRFLNPGPFNIKEHAAIIIMCSTAAGSAIAIQVISVQDLFYNNKMNAGIAIFTLIASQTLGYGMAGLLMKVCVWPSHALWPSKIPVANTFQALHFDGGLSTKRLRFFWTVFAVMFVYEIFPQWIFPLLTGISIVCLVQHTNPVVRNIFGGASNNEGMGLLSFCMEWNYIGSANLYTPLQTQMNINAGIVLTYILMSAVYYGNIWRGLDFPFMSQAIFDTNGNEYNQTAILTNGRLDKAKYESVGQAYFSATNALFLIVDNLSIGAALTGVFLFNWQELKPLLGTFNIRGLKRRFSNGWRFALMGDGEEFDPENHDEHYAKMKIYKPIPQWWFILLLIAAFAMAQATNYAGKSGLPWWAFIIIILLAFLFTIVYAFLAAVLGFGQFSSGGTGLYQLICSKLVPGNPVANMYAAMYGNNPQVQAIALLGDMKLGTYVKIPPKVTFYMQMLGTIVGALLNYVMAISIIDAQRPALLSISGTRLWSGQNAQSYNSNAIAWGALGPVMFGSGSTYWMVPASLGIGCLIPIPFYIASRIWPKQWIFKYILPTVILQYSCYMSVGVNTSVNTSMVIGIISQWVVRKRYPKAFVKYNYLFAGAMDGGTQVISFILNFAVFGAAGNAYAFPAWWGNDPNYSADRCALPPS